MLNIKTKQIARPHAVLCNGGIKGKAYLPDYSSIHVLLPISEEEFKYLMSSEFKEKYDNNRKSQIGEMLIIGETTTANFFNLAQVIFPIKVTETKQIYQEFCTFDRSDYRKALVIFNEDTVSAFNDVIKYLKKPKYVLALKLDINLEYERLQDSSPLVSL